MIIESASYRRYSILGWLFILMSVIIWSTSEVAVKLSQNNVFPLYVAAWRFLLGSFVFLLFITTSHIKFTKSQVQISLYCAFWGVFICFGSIHLAVDYIDSHIVSALYCCFPLFMPFIAEADFDNSNRMVKLYSTVVLLIIAFLLLLSYQSWVHFVAILLGFVSAYSFAKYSICMSKISAYTNLISILFLSTLFGSVLLFILSCFFVDKPLTQIYDIPIVPLLWMSIFVVAIARVLYFQGLLWCGEPYYGSLLVLLKPLIAYMFSTMFLNETASNYTLIALMLIMLSTCIILLLVKKEKISSTTSTI
jgi:drug/metabolite transporter (DMT)-like permease